MQEESKVRAKDTDYDYITPRVGKLRTDINNTDPVKLKLDKNVKEGLLSENKRSRKSWSQYRKRGIDMRESSMRWTVLILACCVLFVV